MAPDRWHQHNVTFADRESGSAPSPNASAPPCSRPRRADAQRLVVHEQAALAAALPRRRPVTA